MLKIIYVELSYYIISYYIIKINNNIINIIYNKI